MSRIGKGVCGCPASWVARRVCAPSLARTGRPIAAGAPAVTRLRQVVRTVGRALQGDGRSRRTPDSGRRTVVCDTLGRERFLQAIRTANQRVAASRGPL